MDRESVVLGCDVKCRLDVLEIVVHLLVEAGQTEADPDRREAVGVVAVLEDLTAEARLLEADGHDLSHLLFDEECEIVHDPRAIETIKEGVVCIYAYLIPINI